MANSQWLSCLNIFLLFSTSFPKFMGSSQDPKFPEIST
ncbi:hypothetical protein GLYMA_16G159850v4 [Glycine max]|nr:hypothetical protein GLYMA_16G159850v4 [Glycine max]KAH1151648.1 hypothetical protein GYH30_045246 [Glycine max]